jgi:hypothetical protein
MPDSAQTARAVAAQLGHYRKLRALARLQRQAVRDGDERKLLAVLADRQEVVDAALALEPDLAAAKRAVPNVPKPIADGLREIRDLLAAITEGDQQDALLMQQRKAGIGRELRKNIKVGGATRAYAAAAYARRSVDVTG